MVTLAIKVVPGASRDGVAGRYGDEIKVRVAAAAEDGKANAAVVRVLADFLGVRREDVAITQGHRQPRKVVTVTGLDAETLAAKLATLA